MFNVSRKSIRHYGTALALVFCLAGAGVGGVHAEDPTYNFNIPAENTAQALTDFSRQTGIQILYPYEIAAAHQTPAISGKLSVEEVLARLLEGSGLEIKERTDKVITLRAALATKNPQSPAAEQSATEVIVTGTHIRNANPTSPVHVINRSDIDRSGYSQIGDLMRSMPENFAGGQNPGVVGASSGNIANQNLTNASTVNLRGLGTDATLVLINGHRLNADSIYQGTDISGVPLAAVQRIEVVTDGASALYGSDAVAGVVNVIMRKSLDGGQWSARVGDTSQGGGAEQTVSWLQGKTFGQGHILANLEYSRQEPITAGQRKFTDGMDPTYTLLRFNERRSLFVNAGYDFTDTLSLGLDALLDDRRAVSGYTAYGSRYSGPVYTPAFNVAGSLDAALSGDWKLRVTAVASGSRNSYSTRNLTAGRSSHTQYKNWTNYVEFTADGHLFNGPGGEVKGAFGGGVRREGYQESFVGSYSYYTAERDVKYLYGEVLAPIVEPSEARAGLHELELSLSARGESYSDMGSSTSPKIGLRYVPISDVTLRATWGKSFKAPSLLQMYQASTVYLWDAETVGGASGGTVLMTYGGNPNLKPERSKSWTVGMDYKLPTTPSALISLNYFHTDYVDRVVQPVAAFTEGLSNPLYAPFVDYDPSEATQAAVIAASGDFENVSAVDYDPSNVVAILHDEYLNATAQRVQGVDLAYKQSFQAGAGTISGFANATWLRLNQQTIITAPDVELSGTLYNVPRFKARGGATWQSGGLTMTGIINYVSGQLDSGVTPNVRLASGTTVDADASYEIGGGSFTKGLRVSLAVRNLFDKAPPRTISPASYLVPHFDSTTGSIIGRFVSLTVSKGW